MTRQTVHPFDWRVLNSRHVLRDRWISVRADTCQMPSGNILDPFYILEYHDWINVVAITPAEEVVLVREYRHGIAQTIVELPGGGMDDKDASPLDCARRELLEETGYTGAEFIELCRLSPNPANQNNLSYSYLALNVERRAVAALDVTEEIEVVLTPLSQVIAMLLANQFDQAMHTAALFYALLKLGKLP